VLTVLPGVPTPPETGLHIRQLVILRLVRDLGHESHTLVFTTAERPQVPDDLFQRCDVVRDAGPRVEYKSLSSFHRIELRARMAGSALLRRPSTTYPFSVPYDQADAGRLITDAAKEMGAEVVILPTVLVHIAPRLAAAGVLVIGDAADVYSQLTRRVLAYGRRAPWRLPGLLVNHIATLSQESLFLGNCAELWATTGAEAESLKQLAPSVNVLVAGNAFDEQLVRSSDIPTDGPIGFIGNYSLAPNLDAACFLAEQVLPLVRRCRPKTRLALAGAGMPLKESLQLQRLPGVDVVGRVDDSSAFIRSCQVMALTVRVRAGVPLKLVEALACGRPIVATQELVEGLPLRDTFELLVGNDPETIARSLLQVLGDRELAQSLAAMGRIRFESEFSYGASLRQTQRKSLLGQRCR
jgi:glycosyltransferase involved in cell wall biosynthesis